MIGFPRCSGFSQVRSFAHLFAPLETDPRVARSTALRPRCFTESTAARPNRSRSKGPLVRRHLVTRRLLTPEWKGRRSPAKKNSGGDFGFCREAPWTYEPWRGSKTRSGGGQTPPWRGSNATWRAPRRGWVAWPAVPKYSPWNRRLACYSSFRVAPCVGSSQPPCGPRFTRIWRVSECGRQIAKPGGGRATRAPPTGAASCRPFARGSAKIPR